MIAPPGTLNGIANELNISHDSEWFYILDTITLSVIYFMHLGSLLHLEEQGSERSSLRDNLDTKDSVLIMKCMADWLLIS